MKLRYYADPYDEGDHKAVLTRLRRIHERHGIPVEVERLDPRHGPIESFPGEVSEGDLETVYERDFSHNRTLSANVGRRPSDAFQTNSGNKTIRGIVGIVDDNLQWATQFRGTSREDREPDPDKYTVEFLDDVIERGRKALVERATEPSRYTEKDVINDFARANVIEGKVRRELEVGGSVVAEEVTHLDPDVAENWFTRQVDLLIEGPEYNWVIEVKKEYGANAFDTALGQVLVSDELYREDADLSDADTKRAVVFGTNDTGFIEDIAVFGHLVVFAKSLGVEVFVGDGDGGFRHLSNTS
jgi:hypothetical protein